MQVLTARSPSGPGAIASPSRRSSPTSATTPPSDSSNSSRPTSGTRTRAPPTPRPSPSSSRWCEAKGVALKDVEPIHVAGYIELLQQRADKPLAAPSVKQHLAAIRTLFDWLVVGQVVQQSPAASVRGPKHVLKKGKTPVLSAADARTLLDSIPIKIGPEPEEGEEDNRPPDLIGLRDRALIATMAFTFARIGAVLGMKVEDYYANGKRWWVRLHEKGGKFHEVPAHHTLEEYLDAYIQAAGIAGDPKSPLFRSANRRQRKADRPAAPPQQRPRHGQAPGDRRRIPAPHLLPHLPGHRHHRLS